MFTGKLTEAQISPANRLCGWQKVLLAYPQGTGKSVIAIAAAEKLLELGLIKNVLILAPTSMAWQWPERLKEFTDGRHDVQYVEAKNKSGRDYDSHSAVYTVLGYSVFRKDVDQVRARSWDLIIADEAQEFSNFRSVTFKAIKKFQPKYRWALTGTIISNKLEELYAVMQWIDKYFLPPWSVFEKRHLVRNPHTKQILKYKDMEILHKHLSSKRVIRKTLSEMVGQLPKLITYKDYVERDDEVNSAESHLLKVLERDTAANLQFDPEVSRSLHSARKAACGPAIRKRALDLVGKILTEDSANRVVIFCFYKDPLWTLKEESPFSTEAFTGDQDIDQKRTSIDRFKRGDSRVLLCSNAGATGLDLPFANYVIHLDVPFSHGIMDQRSTRIQRTSSQFDTVICYYLLVKDSIDEYYFQMTLNKGKLAKAATEGGQDSILMKGSSLRAYLVEKDELRAEDRTV